MDDEWPIESYNMDDLWTIYEWDFYELLMPSLTLPILMGGKQYPQMIGLLLGLPHLSKEVGKQYFRVTNDFYLMELTMMKGGAWSNNT